MSTAPWKKAAGIGCAVLGGLVAILFAAWALIMLVMTLIPWSD